MEKLVKTLKDDFQSQGFHIVEPFRINDYNNICKHKLDNLGSENGLGFIVGCNKYFWDHFVNYIKSLEELPKDPMNMFCKDTIEKVVGANQEVKENNIQYDIRYDWNTVASGRYVHIQTAGHFAGIAHYDRDVMWSCHPCYGLWFVFRAIVVFNINFDETVWPIPNPSEPLFDEETKQEMKKWTNIAIDEGWSNIETRLKIRDSCTIGKEEWRYQGDTFDYFYPLHRTSRQVLIDIIESDKNQQQLKQLSIQEVGSSQCCNTTK